MKQTIETEIKIDWAELYKIVYDDIVIEGEPEPNKYEVLEQFEVNSYTYLCDYFGYDEYDEYGNFINDTWFTEGDVDSAIDEFKDYIESLKD